MKARTYGLITLAFVGVLPLLGFGYLAIDRAERTAISEVRAGNREIALSVAERIAAFAASERELLRSMGSAVALAPDREAAEVTLRAYALSYPRFRNLAVVDDDGALLAGEPSAHAGQLLPEALEGEGRRGQARPADEDASGAFSHAFSIAEPIVVAGERHGVILADVDLTGIWKPVNDILIGKTGFARLLSTDGQLLAHGNPDERRFVFEGVTEENAGIVSGALLGQVVENRQGREVVATPAFVPGVPWLVVIEQQVSEAFGPAQALARSLWFWSIAAVLVAVGVGLMFGRTLVRPLERLREHTRRLARGDLEARVSPDSPLVEVGALAEALNEMAASLKTLQDEAQKRARLATFSRVAAGLAHDLRQPLEAVRTACDALVQNPDEPGALALMESVNQRDIPRLKRYMDDLRRLAQTGEMSVHAVPLSPRGIADTVVANMQSNPKWAGVEFSARGQAHEIEADPQLVERAVTNLTSNAADACMACGPEGRVEVAVEDTTGGDAVAFHITDTGPGIEPERLPTIFHADFTSTKRASGVGLGLGVVRQVADTHGGGLEVDSEPGEGTTFTMWIPRAPCESPSDTRASHSDEADRRAQIPRPSEGSDDGTQAPHAGLG